MAKLANRAWMFTATIGIGTITLGGIVSGYQTFASAGISNGDVVRYTIIEGSNWEIGKGTYTSAGTTLSRTVSESSNSGSPIALAGLASVFIDATDAEFSCEPDQTITAAGTVTVAPGDHTILVNKSVLSNTAYSLPTLASRNYRPLDVHDYSGNGGDHVFTPNGAERIHGQATWTATSVGAGFPFVIRLYPFTGVGWTVE